jgi:putative transposase
MPRAARLVLPGVPHHVTQRGNRRQPTFFSEGDYAAYLNLLRYWCGRSETAVWAWCLMPNHVHLILVPGQEDGLRAALAETHRRYTWLVNRREGWSGHLWQSRFASFPMDEAHVHACLGYVELNPVRAGLVAAPEDWRWSSARAHLGFGDDAITDLAAARARVEDWRAFLDAGLDDGARDAIRARETSGRPLGRVGDGCLQLSRVLPETSRRNGDEGMGTVTSNCPRVGRNGDSYE